MSTPLRRTRPIPTGPATSQRLFLVPKDFVPPPQPRRFRLTTVHARLAFKIRPLLKRMWRAAFDPA